MTLHGRLFFFLFITIIWFRLVSTSTGLETCSCNVNSGVCEELCCCDVDCSPDDIKRFNCDFRSNEAVNSIASKGTAVQTTCFKDMPIYRSNAPHVVRKSGDLICVDHERDTDMENTYHQRLLNLPTHSVSKRSVNIDDSNLSPLGTVVNLTVYQAGTSVLRYMPTTNTSSYYSLPISAFNSATCAGTRPITYMNNFKSTCNQPVNQQTCLTVLDTTKYSGSFCLVQNPLSLAAGTPTSICCNTTGSLSGWTGTCANPLQTLTLTIFYYNPTGIVGCNVSLTVAASANSGTSVQQTFTVTFVQSGATASSVPRSGNPGYFQGAPIIAGIVSGSSISTSDFTVLQASSTDDCTGTNRHLVRFGQNIQATCLFNSVTSGSCPPIASAPNLFMPFNLLNVYVAAYGNPVASNITGYWLPVTFCTSTIGSSNPPVCQTGSVATPSSNQCYTRADIQIVYANIGSVTNPQPVLGAVVVHYQAVSITATSTLPTPFVVTQTVTFQDVSNAPATADGLISRPNTRLPGDFFYPFSLNRATNSIVLSSTFCLINLFIVILI